MESVQKVEFENLYKSTKAESAQKAESVQKAESAQESGIFTLLCEIT